MTRFNSNHNKETDEIISSFCKIIAMIICWPIVLIVFIIKLLLGKKSSKSKGCYIATAVYGSYDCPEVWTLRRYRDNYLAKHIWGRLFIRAYYYFSPTFVRLFSKEKWFNIFFREKLDSTISKLNSQGYSSEKYEDIEW